MCAKINGSLVTNTPKKSLPVSPYIDKKTRSSLRRKARVTLCADIPARAQPGSGRASIREGAEGWRTRSAPRARVCFLPRGARVLGFCTETLPVRCFFFSPWLRSVFRLFPARLVSSAFLPSISLRTREHPWAAWLPHKVGMRGMIRVCVGSVFSFRRR